MNYPNDLEDLYPIDETEDEEEIAAEVEELYPTKVTVAPRLRPRARTIPTKELQRQRKLLRIVSPEEEYPEDVQRPTVREDCKPGGVNEARPCPFVSCVHHLYLDVNEKTGAIRMNYPTVEVWDMPETCALDIADRGGMTLEEVGEIMKLTRERIRQVEVKGLAKSRVNKQILYGCEECGSDVHEIQNLDDFRKGKLFACKNCGNELREVV